MTIELTFVIQIVLSVFIVLIAVFCMMGDDVGSNNRYVNRIRQFFVEDMLHSLQWIIQKTLGIRIYHKLVDQMDYCLFELNPYIQVFYLVLITGGYGLFITFVHPMIQSWFHIYLSGFMIMLALGSFYLACTVPPGVICKNTKGKQFVKYQYDAILYHENRTCSTCEIQKPPRSKHCSVCDHCVSRFDHHCAWLNQCVGENNYRYFIFFLASNILLLVYGAYIISFSLYEDTLKQNLWNSKFYHYATGAPVNATVSIVLRYVLYQHQVPSMLFLMSFVMGPVLSVFLGFHLYIASKNLTTNEFFKWRAKRSSTEPCTEQQHYYDLGSKWKNVNEMILLRRSGSAIAKKQKKKR